MSRTDVHRPWSVQEADPYERHRWYRSDIGNFLPVYQTCGCWMCTGRPWRKLGHRQVRVIWRSIRQELVKLQDYEDVDVGPISGSAWR